MYVLLDSCDRFSFVPRQLRQQPEREREREKRERRRDLVRGRSLALYRTALEMGLRPRSPYDFFGESW
jgi:hypothetical protein